MVCVLKWYKAPFNNYVTPKLAIFDHPSLLVTHCNKSSTTHPPFLRIISNLKTPYQSFRYLFMFHSTHYFNSEVKETLRTDAIGVKNVCKGHKNVSERYKIFKSFNFIQIIFMG